MLTDYHMHLQPDGVEPRERQAERWEADGGHLSATWIGRYVARARARAVEEIAITEHVYRFSEAHGWLGNPFWREESTEDADAYCAAVVAAREEAGLPVLLGVEMDWLPDRTAEIAAFLDGRPFDVVLGSVHFIDGRAIDDPTAEDRDWLPVEELWTRYLGELTAAAGSGLYDVMSHPDLPKVFGRRIPAHLDRLLDDAVAAIADAGVAVECSSAGLRKPVAELYPEPGLLARFRRAGVPVTLSSDAHAPGDVGRDFATAVAALRGAGYETITRFSRREPSQVTIRWG
ncbi:MAG TPA: PHP domain-containing protein [Miltoncostaea sp.]|nr:PHP domain-containing protein [Miltoncostaea sp.]